MSNPAITTAVQQLKQEHIRLCKELSRVDEALSALGNLDGIESVKAGNQVKARTAGTKRKISPAARKKMSEAARARWAARKKEKTAAK
jgi:hypothetical protein